MNTAFTFAYHLRYVAAQYSYFYTELKSQLLGNLSPKSKSTIILPLRNISVKWGAKTQAPPGCYVGVCLFSCFLEHADACSCQESTVLRLVPAAGRVRSRHLKHQLRLPEPGAIAALKAQTLNEGGSAFLQTC